MTDQAKLREAIKRAREHLAICDSRVGFAGFQNLDDVRIMLDAAESTLPKTKMVWDISGCGRNRSPYERDIRCFDHGLIAGHVLDLLGEGFGRVTVVALVVPA